MTVLEGKKLSLVDPVRELGVLFQGPSWFRPSCEIHLCNRKQESLSLNKLKFDLNEHCALSKSIGLAKKFVLVFHTILWKNPNEPFGQPYKTEGSCRDLLYSHKCSVPQSLRQQTPQLFFSFYFVLQITNLMPDCAQFTNLLSHNITCVTCASSLATFSVHKSRK